MDFENDLQSERNSLFNDWARLNAVDRFFRIKFEKEIIKNSDDSLNVFKLNVCKYMRCFLDIFHENVFDIYLHGFNQELDLNSKVEEFENEIIAAESVSNVYISLEHLRDNLKLYHKRSIHEIRSKIDKNFSNSIITTFYNLKLVTD